MIGYLLRTRFCDTTTKHWDFIDQEEEWLPFNCKTEQEMYDKVDALLFTYSLQRRCVDVVIYKYAGQKDKKLEEATMKDFLIEGSMNNHNQFRSETINTKEKW